SRALPHADQERGRRRPKEAREDVEYFASNLRSDERKFVGRRTEVCRQAHFFLTSKLAYTNFISILKPGDSHATHPSPPRHHPPPRRLLRNEVLPRPAREREGRQAVRRRLALRAERRRDRVRRPGRSQFQWP